MSDKHWGPGSHSDSDSDTFQDGQDSQEAGEQVLPNAESEKASAAQGKPATKIQQALENAEHGTARKKEWILIERIVAGLYAEQRKSRRWGIVFKSLTFIYLFSILGVFIYSTPALEENEFSAHTAVIEIQGAISAQDEANADAIIWALRAAFEEPAARAVVMRINSPGGSPVQAGYVYDEIKRLRAIHNKPVYAVITDIGASGAYYIAAAADEIYADKASLVGSIGVVAGGFGFVGLMEKLGVERRLYTAGENKAFLDPFSPSSKQQAQLWQKVLDTTHQQFINQVKLGRGDRLDLSREEELFSGLVWSGEQAVELGLIDGLASTSSLARDLIGEPKLIDYSPQKQVWEELLEQFSVSFAKTIATELKTGSPIQLQ